MKSLLLSAALLCSLTLLSQQQYSYVRVQILPHGVDTIRYYINVDKGNELANAVYALQSNNNSDRVKDKTFYLSKSVILNKIAATGWEFFAVDPEIISTSELSRFETRPVNTHSENYYIFRKLVSLPK
jgi:hypothetical protein